MSCWEARKKMLWSRHWDIIHKRKVQRLLHLPFMNLVYNNSTKVWPPGMESASFPCVVPQLGQHRWQYHIPHGPV